MTPEQRIEAVALAISGQDRELEDKAKAAILATLQSLREPSGEMLSAGFDARAGYEAAVWRAMLDVLIAEHGNPTPDSNPPDAGSGAR